MTYCVVLKIGYEEVRFLFKEAQEAVSFVETAVNAKDASAEGAKDVKISMIISKEEN